MGQKLHLPIRVRSFASNELPDLKSAGLSNNTTGLLTSCLSIPGPQPTDPDAPAPDSVPGIPITLRILPAMPQCNFILITSRAADGGDSATSSFSLLSSRVHACPLAGNAIRWAEGTHKKLTNDITKEARPQVHHCASRRYPPRRRSSPACDMGSRLRTACVALIRGNATQ